MTRARPLAVATSLSVALAGAVLLLPQPGAAAPSRAAHTAAPAAAGHGGPNTYFSTPPDPLAAKVRHHHHAKRPKAPPTKGTVTGRVTGPNGTPIRNALVTGIRFSDLGLPVDLTQEKRVLARTDASGRFTLKQLREPYLVRVCSESVSSGGGHRARRSGECDQESTKRFTPSYVGPDGSLNSWMRHTRFFRPVQPRRDLGRIVVQPPAVVTGTWKGDGGHRLLRLTRVDGSVAAQTVTDANGDYRFEVAPGPYRVEADRDEGLHTDSTVPGFLSKRLLLRAGRTVHVSFKTRHAGIVRGQVTSGGVPLPNQFLTILDRTGAFAAGVVTNDIGRYVVTSLEPGPYTVTTSYAGSAYVPTSQVVAVAKKKVATADLALDPGRSVSVSPSDTGLPGANGSVDAELRNADGRVLKVWQGDPASLPGATITFTGLPIGTYSLYLRRSAVPSDGPEQTEFPWAGRAVDLVSNTAVALGVVPLDQPTVNLTGTLPKGGQVKLTAIPEDSWLRPAYVDGDQATAMAVNWTEQSEGGQYTVRGIVPGTYTAAVTTARKERGDKPSTTGANLAATHSLIVVNTPAPTAAFTAPTGAKVRGEMRYAGSHRPVIAPFGFRVFDQGDQSWLFPTVSGEQKYDRPFRVELLHAGKAGGRLLDLDALYGEHPDVLIPDTLVSSARNEPGTPYWFTARKGGIALTEGRTTDIGVVELKLHGVNGVRAVIGHGGRSQQQ
ncbi:MAG TPA: carboxypeptidase-like regulatory domain-containing protein [Nocardioides sp.]|uniref:carboxypeptidase-like regulatory domain-containing protein n=1 Tax=Nocardioides sp. TaxID=35761 RepID=UPI002E36192B|nr:carboxypeptidase-like regulatory domain-containing protein [Nocardioides sp.]HEX5089887.1 carboxypeptidase-like regulatory domain-containing protein [Nocardioides sp.]